MMSGGNYTTIDGQRVSGSVPAVPDPGHVTVKFSESNLQQFPQSQSKWKIYAGADSSMGEGGSDDVVPSSMSKVTVFVTVGTTSFDKLVMAADTSQVKKELCNKGYTHLVIQMGRGSYIPQKSGGEDGSLVVDYFTFSPSIADHLKAASLVISHAGSGSIFETLRLGKPLIVVVNEDLMDNHQIELAEELAEWKHLYCARPQRLAETIASMDVESLLPYVPGDATPVVKHINRFLGFPED